MDHTSNTSQLMAWPYQLARLASAVFLVCLLIFPLAAQAQEALEKEGVAHLFKKDYDSAKDMFRKMLGKDSTQVFPKYGIALCLYEQVLAEKQKNALNLRFTNMQGYLDSLSLAHIYATKASEEYQKLSTDDKKAVRRPASIPDDEIRKHLLEVIEKEAYGTLSYAPYRKDIQQLYGTQVYNRVTDADTLMLLRESLLDQCTEFLDYYPFSAYHARVEDFRRAMLREHTQIASLRQFGDRSGKMYEKYCYLIIELFSSEELKHIVPDFYGAEYGFGNGSGYRNKEPYKKLEKLAKQYDTDVINLLCELNIHYHGASKGKEKLYDDFIQLMAPSDIALIAVQKLAETHVYKNENREAANIWRKYAPYFPEQQAFFKKTYALILSDDKPTLVNMGAAINSEYKDFSPVLSLDGKTLYFARKTAQTGEDIYVSHKIEGDEVRGEHWTVARPLPFNINTKSHEIPLGLSSDNSLLMIYGNYSVLGKYSYLLSTEKRLGKGDFYYAEQEAEGWGRIQVYPYPVNTPHYETGLTPTADGKAVLFSSDRPGAVGGHKPNYPPDKLYYHGSGEFNLDIYICEKTEGGWGEPINLGETINTPFAEKDPYLHPDMETLYFASDGHYGLGGYDIYMSKRLNKNSWTEWSEPVNLGKSINSPFNDSFYMSTKGDRALVVTNRANKNYGMEDIYWVDVPKEYQPEPVVVVTGQFLDDKGKPAETTIEIVQKKDTTQRRQVFGHHGTGRFGFTLAPGETYYFYGEKDRHFAGSNIVEIDVTGQVELLSFDSLIISSIDPNDRGRKPFILRSLYFDNDDDIIQEQSAFDLSRVAKLLQENPDIRLSIEGHTDSNASHDYNIELSERRTASVKTYLVGRGVAPNRLEALGYGETRPIATNKTDEGRQLNRRVEFRVLGNP